MGGGRNGQGLKNGNLALINDYLLAIHLHFFTHTHIYIYVCKYDSSPRWTHFHPEERSRNFRQNVSTHPSNYRMTQLQIVTVAFPLWRRKGFCITKFWKDIRNLKQHSIGHVVTSDSSTTLSSQLTLSSPLFPPPHPPYRDVCAFIRVIISLLPHSGPSAIDLAIHLVLFLATASSDNGLAILRQPSDF